MSQFDPIAIVGIGCRFPGADGPESFWRLLADGIDAISEVPADRWSVDALYDADPTVPGKMSTRWGGFLSNIDRFDAAFFGISPREAAHVDPQQRLLLEVAWEAMEDAGVPPESLAGQKVGVFIGMASCDYGHEQLADIDQLTDGYPITGSALSIGANRLSYVFDFRGPSLTIDTACSSSLVAVYQACQSIHRGESLVALAGGVNVILSPAVTIGFSKLQAMAPDGRCRAFDASANGFVRGEGVGLVLVKSLTKALSDGDRIYAVIRGGAINQDGKTNGLTAPNGLSQEALLREAMANSRIRPADYQYVEAHGTGTALGDPIELNALGGVLAAGRSREARCAVGSVKTNIGHLEAAAGVAGLIKLALSISRRQLPPSLHFERPNPYVRFDVLPLKVVTQLEPWPASDVGPVGGVSSFGFGGTNAHLVLEAAPPEARGTRERDESDCVVLPLSARSQDALVSLAQAYATWLEDESESSRLVDICATAAVRRSHHACRVAVEASSRSEMVSRLKAFLDGEPARGVAVGRRLLGRRRRVAFVFPGQGSQWLGMGRALIATEPVFADVIDTCSAAFREHAHWSLTDELRATPEASRLAEVDIVQPAIFAVQVALAALWRSWGIKPDAVVGHSMGEVAAAHVAGALSLVDAARIICRRSQVVRRTSGQGAMAVVELSFSDARVAITGYEERLSVAVSNSPTSTVLSGEPTALDAVLVKLEREGTFVRRVNVDYASHSPQMDPLRDELLTALQATAPRRTTARLYSTVTGTVVAGPELGAEYWARNLREPVLFADVVAHLIRDGIDVFLEVSPHPILLSAVQQCLDHAGREGVVLGSLQREEPERRSLLSTLTCLYAVGGTVAWDCLYGQSYERVPLPRYPWQRERFWFPSDRHAARPRPRRDCPLIGDRIHAVAGLPLDIWQLDLSSRAFTFLKDHRRDTATVAPVSAMLEMVLEAASETISADTSLTIAGIRVEESLLLSDDESRRVQVILRGAGNRFDWQVSTVPSAPGSNARDGICHACGEIRAQRAETRADNLTHVESPAEILARCQAEVSLADHATAMSRLGFEYGESLQMLEQLWRGEHEALARLKAAPPDVQRFRMHPSVLDSVWQLLLAELFRGSTSRAARASIERFRVHRAVLPQEECWAHAVSNGSLDRPAGDARLLTKAGDLVAELQGVRFALEERPESADSPDLFSLVWERQAIPPDRGAPKREGALLMLADATGVSARLCALASERHIATLVARPGDRFRGPHDERTLEWQIDPAVSEHYARLLEEVARRGIVVDSVVHLWSLDGVGAGQERVPGWHSLLLLLQHMVDHRDHPRLCVVTRGAQHVAPGDDVAAFQAPVWGMARTAFQEHSELAFLMVDLPGMSDDTWAPLVLDELAAECAERQVAFRDGERLVARLEPVDQTRLQTSNAWLSSDETTPFRPEIQMRTSTDARIYPMARRRPSAGELELEVVAAGLSARHDRFEVTASGDGRATFGVQCAGRVRRLGAGVTGWSVGDEVVALARSSVASSTIAQAALVVAKPAHLSFDVAATTPLAFLGAFYALQHLARTQPDERVLVQGAGCDVEMACVRLALRMGATVYATASSDEQRDALEMCGVRSVIDVRQADALDAVLEATAGDGVDVVVSSHWSEGLGSRPPILRPGGRWVHLGAPSSQELHQVLAHGLAVNRSIFVADVWALAESQPELCGRLLRDAMRAFEAIEGPTPPPRVFTADQLRNAMEHIARPPQPGGVVVRIDRGAAELCPATDPAALVRDDATYLIVGGLGRLGLLVARWLSDSGARSLVLAGRRDPSPRAREAISAMERDGVQVVVERMDVSDAVTVNEAFARWHEGLPRLRGIVHAAGLLDNGILIQQTPDRFRSVLAAKALGAWHLHRASLALSLDFFVLFSSASSVMGSAGQSNDAAANECLNAIVHHRRAHGLPAASINWGPWSRHDEKDPSNGSARLEIAGMGSLSPTEGIEMLGRIVLAGMPQIAVMKVDWPAWCRSYPFVARQPFFARLRDDGASEAQAAPGDRAAIGAASPDELATSVVDRLRQHAATVLRLPPSKIDLHQPLVSMGIDSLMAVELKGRVEREFGVAVPLLQLIKGPSLIELADLLATSLTGRPLALETPRDTEVAPVADAAATDSEARRKSLLLTLLSSPGTRTGSA